MKAKVLNLFLTGFIFIHLVWSMAGCCLGGGDDYRPNTSYTFGMKLLDTTNLITEVQYAGASGSIKPNKQIAEWKLSLVYDNTVIYITTQKSQDTIVIASATKYESYYSSCDNNNIRIVKSPPTIIYHTFDTAYIWSSYNYTSSSYNYNDGDTLYFK